MVAVEQKRRGISTFIATLLMMVLAVAAGVVIYAYTMGYLGGLGGPQTMGAMSIDTSSLDSATGTMTAYIRNIGHTTIIFDKLYLNNEDVTVDMFVDEQAYNDKTGFQNSPLKEGGVAKITVEGNFESTKTYEFKLIAKDNTQITFSLKAK